MLQCVAVWCSVLQCVAVCCSVLQCVAVCCSVSQCVALCCSVLQCDTFNLGWRRSTGCLKLQVIFCNRATNYRALLRKITFTDRASYDVRHSVWQSLGCMTPVHHESTFVCDMNWGGFVGSFKLQASFAKEPYNRDEISQKRPIILWSLLFEAYAIWGGFE